MRLVLSFASVVLFASLAPAAVAQRVSDKREYRLPVAAAGDVAAMPEGIDVDERTDTYFTGATSDGTIYRGGLNAPVAETFLPAGTDGRLAAQGIEIDDERRLLFIATAFQGTVDAYDIDTKEFVGRYSAGLGGYINDVAVTPAGDVYFTDSVRPTLYRVRTADVRSQTTAEAIPIPQSGPFSYSVTSNGGVEPNAVFNAGGIDAIDDRTLIVTQINEGRLFRFEVDPESTEATITEIEIEGGADNLDALELVNSNRAFTTDNLAEELLTLELGPDASMARVVQRTSEQNFCTPTAVGLVEGAGRVVVTNAQLFRPSLPPFSISSLPLPLDGTVEDNPDRGQVGLPCTRDIQGGQPVPEPTGPETAPGFADAADARARRAPALSISRARLRNGVVSLRAAITRRVAGERVRIGVASKFALRAFSECLQHELRHEPNIGVAIMLPQAVDTPIFAHAGNYAQRSVRPIPPLVDPEEVADGIVQCARDPKCEVTYRRLGRAVELLHSLAPGLYHRILPSAFEAGNYGDGAAPANAGQVLEPQPSARSVHGGWKQHRRKELAQAFVAMARGGARGLLGR